MTHGVYAKAGFKDVGRLDIDKKCMRCSGLLSVSLGRGSLLENLR